MFGYKKGAFTGAYKDTPGLFEKADGGTVFLDEVGDISPYMQQALLRVIQEKEIQPIGGKPQKVDVRIISATNQDLVSHCESRDFRWDLYYRLAVAELEVPTLKERGPDEIKEMIHYFLKQKKKELKKQRMLKIDKDALQFLLNYPYPGNIRELENLVESLYVFCDERVTLSDIPARFSNIPAEESLHWKDAEKAHIKRVLKLKNGNQRQAWLALGYGSLNTLKKKIEEYGIEVRERYEV
jgi:transcriptional regulator with PAS, ATPase and Fis domain